MAQGRAKRKRLVCESNRRWLCKRHVWIAQGPHKVRKMGTHPKPATVGQFQSSRPVSSLSSRKKDFRLLPATRNPAWQTCGLQPQAFRVSKFLEHALLLIFLWIHITHNHQHVLPEKKRTRVLPQGTSPFYWLLATVYAFGNSAIGWIWFLTVPKGDTIYYILTGVCYGIQSILAYQIWRMAKSGDTQKTEKITHQA